MEVESDKVEQSTTRIPNEIEEEQQHQPERKQNQQQMMLAKQKKKLKKQKKNILALQQFGFRNIFVKDLSYDKKILLMTDVVIDLDLFSDEQARFSKFEPIACWRTPQRITSENSIVHIDLDTQVDGLDNFDQVSKILNSIPNQHAHDLSIQIQQYNIFLNQYAEKNKDFMYIFNLISHDKKQNYTLSDYFEEIVQKQMNKAMNLVNSLYQKNKFLSYMVKTRKRNNKVISRYGYSMDLLELLGIEQDNVNRLLFQNGPLQFFANEDKIQRLKNSLDVRMKQLTFFSQYSEEIPLKNQTIITFDDFKFQCDISLFKDDLTNDQNFYVQQAFKIQIAVYDITDDILKQLSDHRSLSSPQPIMSNGLREVYFGLDYEAESEMFIKKFYSS